ncbi:hypothetical protein FE257_003008 [Aspergillus nanangensis]|uniref:PBSP domain protein n=1 Tax=Aspergillus nanangensis TaxID=2582783 RepID=A0AAD4CC51_ASPNN|nr:hypothetical protein FE257_003008 [Aspergillus nanangensis]
MDSEPSLPKPKILLHINDLRHKGTKPFLSHVPDVASTLETALTHIIANLYTPNGSQTFTPTIPPTRSVTVLLRDIGGVAYTTGTELDNDHKEIHLSLSYVVTSAGYADPAAELVGVLTHELVHCYQHTAPSCAQPGVEGCNVPHPPGGLIEGIADFVRLKAGLVPSHWKQPKSAKERAEKWDKGYQDTAYFLAWLEDVHVGKGAIGMVNDRLLRSGYVGETSVESHTGGKDDKGMVVGFWKGLFGVEVQELWDEYGRYLDAGTQSMQHSKNGGNWEEEIVNPE